MKHYRVAAGILCDAMGRVLITERLCDDAFNGLWEFPGGKIGTGETALEALQRELLEELGVEVTETRPFMEVRHEYPDRTVDLAFFLVTSWRGEARGLERQSIRWVATADLDDQVLLPADKPVVDSLRKL